MSWGYKPNLIVQFIVVVRVFFSLISGVFKNRKFEPKLNVAMFYPAQTKKPSLSLNDVILIACFYDLLGLYEMEMYCYKYKLGGRYTDK